MASSSSSSFSKSFFFLLFMILSVVLFSSSSSSATPFSPRPLLLLSSDDHFDSIIANPTLSDEGIIEEISGPISSHTNASSIKSSSSSSSCEPTYGFLPCTDSVLGNLFLLAVYAYLLFVAAKLMSKGSELLLTILDVGLIGGLLLPILGALPDSILILVSGLGGTQTEAQEQILVGIGLLAGSIVMLLTVLWGSCLLLGRCDLKKVDGSQKLTAEDKKLTRHFDLTGTGVENDELTMLSARIMVLSVIPFIVAQLARIFNFTSIGNIPVIVACVLSFAGLLSYCLYQVFTPLIQERRKEIAQKVLLKDGVLKHFLHKVPNARLINERGILDLDVAKKLFETIDNNKDGLVEIKELRLVLAVAFVEGEGNQGEMSSNQIMEEYDVNHDEKITLDEFLNGLRKWSRELNQEKLNRARTYLDDLERFESEETEEEEAENGLRTKSQIIRKAVFLLIMGTIIAAVFADPLVDAVTEFSTSSHIPSFFISFVLLPLASNSNEAVSSILFSSRKKKRNMSLTYSQIYGGVTMNCTMGLGIFLALVYFRDLVWDFSSEVLIVCLVTIIMGFLASFRTVFPTWMAGIALLLYPFSLGLVAVLDYVAGWQ